MIFEKPIQFKIRSIVTIDDRTMISGSANQYNDALTGLKNMDSFENDLKRIDLPQKLPLTIVLCDINKFNLINDVLGSAIGNKMLQSFSTIFRRSLRPNDILARIEHDKFGFIFPNTRKDEAEEIIEELRNQVANDPFNVLQMSMTFGFKTKSSSAESIVDIVNAADNALRHAKTSEKSTLSKQTVLLILKTLFQRNRNEESHSRKVGNLAKQIGEKLDLPAEMIRNLKIAGIMHDIGKISVDGNILHKKEKLTGSEWIIVKSHAESGYRILNSTKEFASIAETVLQHHERWDGKGYPKGLKEEEILLSARIIAVCEAYETLTSFKTYRKHMSREEAINELKRCAGSQFDPSIVNTFAEMYKNKEQ